MTHLLRIARGLLVVVTLLGAQPATDVLRFEAASIKVVPPPSAYVESKVDPDRIDYKSVNLKWLVMMAYGMDRDDVIGPNWMDSQFYDVSATMPLGTLRAQRLMMMQTLLAERWQMSAHSEQKVRPVYAVTVAKAGIKMKALEPFNDQHYPIHQKSGYGVRSISGKMSVSGLLRSLRGNLLYPMRDLTGLTDVYDINLEWVLGDLTQGDKSAGTLFGEMEKQLGLKVAARKIPIDVLAIDHIEKVPSRN